MDKTSTNERTIFSAQHCAALSAAHVGKALSPEHRAAIAAGVKRQWQRRQVKTSPAAHDAAMRYAEAYAAELAGAQATNEDTEDQETNDELSAERH